MRYFLILIGTILISSCANRSTPTGGPKDEEPPEVTLTIPAQGERNYSSQEIILTFNEDITVKTPKSQILITPRTDINYEIKYKRNQVTLLFDSLLDANTTYTISFRESIVDITENNPAINLQLAFSTGPDLDTLIVRGSVNHAYTREPSKEATVVLYRESDTTDIFTGLPYYFTQTNDSGAYELKNLKDGNYRMYAMHDYNNDLKVQSDSEPYGFILDTLTVTASNAERKLTLVNLDIDSLKVFSARRLGSTFNIKYSKAVTQFSHTTDDSLLVYQDFDDPSVLRVQSFENISTEDSIAFSLTAYDSIGFEQTSIFYGKFDKSSSRKQDFNVSITAPSILVKDPTLNYHLNFTKPAFISNIDSLYIQIDSLTRYSIDTSHLHWNSNHTDLIIRYTLDESLFKKSDTLVQDRPTSSARPYLKWAKQSFVSFEGDTLRSGKEDLSFLPADGTSAMIIVASNVPEYPIIIQFFDDSDEEILRRKVLENGSYTFQDISPGNYIIRIIHDANNNGKWDPGNYYKQEQPERIQYLRDESGSNSWDLRANWSFEQSINLTRE